MVSLLRRLAPVLWNGVAGATPRVAILLAGLYVAHHFGTDTFGRFSLALSTFALAGSLPGSTLATVVSKFVPEFARGEGERLGEGFGDILRFTMLLAGATGSAVLLLAPVLSDVFAVVPPVTGLLRSAGVATLAAVVSSGLLGMLMGAGRFGTAAAAQVAGFVLFAIAIVPLSGRLGAAGVLVSLGVLYAGSALVAALASRTEIARGRRSRSDRLRMRRLWRFFVPMLLAAGLVTPVSWFANTLLARGSDPLAELSRFNAAYAWFAALTFVPAVLAQVEFVRIAQARSRGHAGALGREMLRFAAQNAFVMAPLVLAGLVLAPTLMGLYRLTGPEAERVLALMLAAAFFAGVGNPAGLFLSATDRIWIASGLNASWGVMTLVVAWTLRADGATGVAVAFLASYLLHAVAGLWLAYRLIAHGPSR
jgi:O-antigen/teichoic acid export membrane protein